MRTFITSVAIFASCVVTATAQAAIAPASKEVTIALSDVYVPGGFSAATDSYVIANGMFPNSCYKWARSEVANVSPMVHEVRSVASVSQTMCLMVMVPYTKEVKLGRLPTGDHTLRFINGDGTYFEKNLKVE